MIDNVVDNVVLNKWAATYMGEDPDDVEQAVDGEWYTSSPTAALGVLYRVMESGAMVELSSGVNMMTVKVGEASRTGDIDDAAKWILEACHEHDDA